MVRYEKIFSGTWWYWISIGLECLYIWLGVTDPRLTHSRINFERENRGKEGEELSFMSYNINCYNIQLIGCVYRKISKQEYCASWGLYLSPKLNFQLPPFWAGR